MARALFEIRIEVKKECKKGTDDREGGLSAEQRSTCLCRWLPNQERPLFLGFSGCQVCIVYCVLSHRGPWRLIMRVTMVWYCTG